MKNRLVLLLAFAALALAGLAAAARTDDPRPGSRRALAVAELIQACDWMHTSTRKHGLGYSVAHVQTTHVYRALVIMGGVWPVPPTPVTTTAATTTAPLTATGPGTGPGTGTGTGLGTGVPPPTK